MAWKVPLGFIESLKAKGFDKTGTLNIGGSIATAGGLIFIGATIDCRFRAFESRTGKQLWETELAGVRAHDADDVSRQGRPPVRRRRGRRRQLPRRRGRLEDRRVRAAAARRQSRTSADEKRAGRSPPGCRVAGVAPVRTRRSAKRVLAWADVRNGYQHDSISHAVATIERLGRESGSYDTFIRTDSQLITKHPITFPAGTGIATGEQFNVRNLNYFDAIFFFGVREIELSPEQRADLLSFVKDDGKGFVAAHSAATAFFSWPEFGEMLGGRFDEHPWGIADGTVVVDDPAFPAMRHFAARVVVPRRAVSDQGFLAGQDSRAGASGSRRSWI